MIGLYLGKYQPFHNGHLSCIEHILKNNNHVVIGVCTKEIPRPLDLLDFKDLKLIINGALARIEIDESQYAIVEVPDKNNHAEWIKNTISLCSPFDIVYTNNPRVKIAFYEQGYVVEELPVSFDCSGTLVRERLLNSEDISELVPPAVSHYLAQVRS